MRCIQAFVGSVENVFHWHGKQVGLHPWRYVSFTFVVFGLSIIGLPWFHQEKNPLRLWVPEQSNFVHDTEWLMKEYGEGLRPQMVLITAPDVLQPYVLQQLLVIHEQIENVTNNGVSWNDVCFKVPIVSFNTNGARRRREVDLVEDETDGSWMTLGRGKRGTNDLTTDDEDDLELPTIQSPPISQDVHDLMAKEALDPGRIVGSDLYCRIIRNMKKGCLQRSLLDLWKYDVDQIANLTKRDIIRTVNSVTVSPTLGHALDFKGLLGGVEKDPNGTIISAKALLSFYMVHVNFSAVDMDKVGNQGGTADWATGAGLDWETGFLRVMENALNNVNGIKVFYEAGRSFGDISSDTMFQDVDKILIGVFMMFVYIQAMFQHRYSWVDCRVIPGCLGLIAVLLAFISAIGICSVLGIAYGPVHTSLPFLLLGLGVDDMFVIWSCWTSLPTDVRTSPLPKKVAHTLRHAGVSVSVTSATDVIAFLVGATTIMPSLRSFCLYASVGIFLTWLFQCTLFVAAVVVDERRAISGRNCIMPCIRHELPPERKTPPPQKNILDEVLRNVYSNFVVKIPGKLCVLLVSLGLLGLGIYGCLHLRQDFNQKWFLPDSSYLHKFMDLRSQYYPEVGKDAGVYLGRLHYSAELPRIGNMVAELKNQTDIVINVDSWLHGFHRYVEVHLQKNISIEELTDEEFSDNISKFLFSPGGAKYLKNFRFERPLECGLPAPPITAASFDFTFKSFQYSGQYLEAMSRVRSIIRSANLTSGDGFSTVWGKIFAMWSVDEIVAGELARNLILAIVCVGVVTAVFLSDPAMCFWVLVCVLITLTDVCGFMYWWGLTIDLVSSVALALAVGLCVDFAAHIGYAFLSCRGSKSERAVRSVEYIGGAVLHGGITTLLALSMLGLSSSYIFIAYFKIFLLIVLFGIFHGLCLLPVILSIVGPAPYTSSMTVGAPEKNTRQSFDAAQSVRLCDTAEHAPERDRS